MARIRTIWNGDEGDAWTNDTGKVAYQFFCNWQNTCGQCAQFDHAISPNPWAIPLHHSCRCMQRLVKPGETAKPWVDFRKRIDALPDAEKWKVVGKANLKLIEEGVVKWEDVVTQWRVRSLEEVVAIRDLTIKQLTDAGVAEATARKAYESVHTPAHEILAAQRKQLVDQLKGAGLSKQQIIDLASIGLGAKVNITAGPGGPSQPPSASPTSPTGPGKGPSPDTIFAAVLAGWSRKMTQLAGKLSGWAKLTEAVRGFFGRKKSQDKTP